MAQRNPTAAGDESFLTRSRLRRTVRIAKREIWRKNTFT